jgi:hypothetical protein
MMEEQEKVKREGVLIRNKGEIKEEGEWRNERNEREV